MILFVSVWVIKQKTCVSKSCDPKTVSSRNIGATTMPPLPTPKLMSNKSEHIGQWATPHHLSDVRRGAPSWIWDFLPHSDVTTYVMNAIHALLCAIAS